MKSTEYNSSRLSSFKIVLLYGLVSSLYIYTSDYFLRMFTSDVTLLSKLQTYKGLGFILITTGLLYLLVKKSIDTISSYYQKVIDVQAELDRKLKISQDEYMVMFDNSPLPMWLFDPETLQFLLVNDTACRVYQFSREEFLSMTLRDIHPKQDIPSLEQVISSSILKSKFELPNIIRHKKKNGEIMEVKINVAFVNFKEKKARLASVVDMSAEIEIQNKLFETNSRLKRSSKIAGLGYWTNDLVKSEIHWSGEIYKIFEVEPKTFELTLNNIMQRFYPEDQPNFNLQFYSELEHHKIIESERRIITGSGKIKWILERQYLTKNKDGAPIHVEGIVLDVTKRKLYEQEIKQSNERFKMLAKATVEAIIDWDIENKEVIWGEGFHTMFGYDLKEYNFCLWSNNIHVEDRKNVLDDLRKTMLDPSKQYFKAEYRFIKANGDIAYVQHNGVFIRNENGKATRALGALIDLTESLTRMRKIELQEKALNDIAWTQSHVVRAPLANLMGLVGLIKNSVNTGIRDEVLLSHISDSAEKLDGVIRNIVNKATEVDKAHNK